LFAAGSIAVGASSNLYGFEANAVLNEFRYGNFKADCLLGLRSLHLHETLGIAEVVNVAPGSGTAFDGTSGIARDQFNVRNQFYGGQIGGRLDYPIERVVFSTVVKVALGDTHQTLNVAGFSQIGARPVQRGGLLALPSNIGTFSRDGFSVVPDLAFTLGYQITRTVRATFGYTFLYWSNVIRSTQQVSLAINPTQIPTNPVTSGQLSGAALPLPGIHNESNFWAQGMTFGIDVRY
jgi:hypothetical protein